MPARFTDQARAALSACRGDPFLARTSTCSCTPDFCQRKPSASSHKAVQPSAQCGRMKAIGEFYPPTYLPARARALPSGLIAALRLRCTLQTGSFCKLCISSSHPIWSTSTKQQYMCSAGALHGEELEFLDKVHVPISDETTQHRTICLPHSMRRLQRMVERICKIALCMG